jgi:hypothetical protein
MDLNQLLHRHQLSLMKRDQAESPDERSAHNQFALDYAQKIQVARDALGAPAHLQAPTDQPAVEISRSGYAPCVTARVVLKPSEDLPYTVVMSHDSEERSRHSFLTMREAETHVRCVTPTPPPHSTLYDRESEQV